MLILSKIHLVQPWNAYSLRNDNIIKLWVSIFEISVINHIKPNITNNCLDWNCILLNCSFSWLIWRIHSKVYRGVSNVNKLLFTILFLFPTACKLINIRGYLDTLTTYDKLLNDFRQVFWVSNRVVLDPNKISSSFFS